MSYTEDSRSPLPTISERPVYTAVTPVVEYHDRVRWGPILAGLMITIVSQLVLSALGGVIGLTAVGSVSAGTAGTVATIWAIFSLLISLFLGGWMMARTCGPYEQKIRPAQWHNFMGYYTSARCLAINERCFWNLGLSGYQRKCGGGCG